VAITTSVVTVTTTAQLIADGTNYTNYDPLPVLLRNDSGTTIYVGGAGVTTATGYAILTGTSLPLEIAHGDQLYAIAASSLALQVLKQRS
jgi:hypothetical protein